MKRWALGSAARISKVKMEPPPLGKYLRYRAWSGWPGREGVIHPLHLGMAGEKLHPPAACFTVALQAEGEGLDALEQEKGGKGEMAAPVSRSRTART